MHAGCTVTILLILIVVIYIIIAIIISNLIQVVEPLILNGPSEKRTTSLQRTSAVLPIEFSIVIVH